MEDGEAIDEDRGRLPFNAEDVIRVIPLDDVLEGRENLDDIIADANNLDGGLETDGADEGTSTAYDEDSVDEVNEDEAKITIQAHQKDVFCVDCFEDHWMASGGEDDCAVLFDLHKNLNEPVHRICEHVDSVTCVRFNASGKLLATGDMSGKIVITEVGESLRKRCEMDEPSELEWLEWHRSVDILFAGAHDGVIWMWLIGTDGVSQTKVFAGGAGIACTVGRVLADGKRLLSGYTDGSIRIWSLKDSSSIGLSVNGASPTCTHLHCKLPIAAIGDESGKCTLINTDTAKVINVFNPLQTDTSESAMDTGQADDDAPTNSVECVQFCGNELNENWLAVGTNTGRLCIYDVYHSQARYVCDHEDGRSVVACRFYSSAEGGSSPFILSASIDGVLRIWDARNGEPITALCGGQNEIFDMNLMAKSQRIVTACASGYIRIFDLPMKKD